ncbi:MAG: hypothetical protein ACE5NG_15325 [bacterium]
MTSRIRMLKDGKLESQKQELLERMPQWFLKLRERYNQKYDDDLFDRLDDLAKLKKD